MKRFLLFTGSCVTNLVVHAQLVRIPVASVYPTLHTYSTKLNDAFSVKGNIAALGGIQSLSAGIHSERRFMLAELSSYSVVAAIPTHAGAFGIQGQFYGGQLYNETTLGLGYGRKLGNHVDVGLQFQYFSMKAQGYGSASAVTFDAGVIFHLTETVQSGLHVYNPVRMKIGKSGNEKLPSLYSAGIGYDVSAQLFLGAEIEKMEDEPLNVNAGIHYQFVEKFMARAGVSTATSVYYLGFGVQLKSFRVDVSSAFHPYLGATPGLMLMYSRAK